MEGRFSAFTYLISSLNRYIRKIKTEEVLEYELKSPHVSCLYYIHKAGKITAKELCDACGDDKGAVSRSLESLEKKGLVTGAPIEGKKYKMPLILTEKGTAIAEDLSKKIDNALEKAGEGLSEEDRITMYRSLEIINRNLSELCKKY
ncbi:MAG: MarR family transcriptional regulator [Clostridia bacterium]|nr:MarR family transcriptional regulator [Clostridia bacterium]